MADSDSIAPLRLALGVSPDNLPLRKLLADSLALSGRDGEAEAEYRIILSRAPGDVAAKLALARCFQRQNKPSAALVLLEDLARSPDFSATACLFYAQVLLAAGDREQATIAYRRAVELDPAVADPSLAAQLRLRDEPKVAPKAPPRAPSPFPFAGPDETNADDADPSLLDGRIRQSRDAGPPSPLIEMERPDTRFADIGGMAGVKDDIRKKIIFPLSHPELYKAYGKKSGGGILLYGPPGCGKTHLARATAGEVEGGFLAVGISQVLDMWMGQSERNLHQIFAHARGNTPCVLFFDEVDALGASRSDMRQSSGRQLINQFLAELDGVDVANDGVLILAATNAPWHLDPAFRRPGRFDRVIFVPPPDEPARAEILRLLLAGKPVEAIDHGKIAGKTDGFSGADLKGLVDSAVEAKLDEAMASGRPVPLSTKDLLEALKRVRATTREWFGTAKNYALFANQGGIYDDIVRYMKLK